MVGKKGQKNPSPHPRKNRYTAGKASAFRQTGTIISFTPYASQWAQIQELIAELGSKQAVCDAAIACLLGEGKAALRACREEEKGEEETLVDAGSLLNQVRSKNPKSKISLQDIELILELLG